MSTPPAAPPHWVAALIPLPLAAPLLAAALLAALSKPLMKRRRVADALALLTAAGTAGVCAVLLWQAAAHPGAPLLHWFGGWTPREHGVVLGIDFAVDPVGAGGALFASVLFLSAFAFASKYFEKVETIFHVLMLVFLGAMTGFCLTGDLFNLFVFFTLMGVAAFALTGYKIEESSLEGAINFAVTNSIAAYLILTGIGLLYGRTGALNLAQIGQEVTLQSGAHGGPDPLILAAAVLVIGGLLVKAAIVPFHFWLSDAHAVAPAPVSMLFSGVMVSMGLLGAFRVYVTVFSGAFAPCEPRLRTVLLGMGAFTILVGGVMCLLQRHLKRLLAFSTISHAGIILCAAALLDPHGVAGAAAYVVGHGLIKAALFLCAGVLLDRYASLDEIELCGRAAGQRTLGVIYGVAALALCGLPPFGVFRGKSLAEDVAPHLGAPWVPWAFVLGAALTGGAILRAGGRIFLGLGPRGGDESGGPTEPEQPDTGGGRQPTGPLPALLLAVPALLTALSLAWGLWPGVGEGAVAAAGRFLDRPAYTAAVLNSPRQEVAGAAAAAARERPPEEQEARRRAAAVPAAPSTASLWYGLCGTAGALLIAGASLAKGRVPGALANAWGRLTRPAADALNALHSGLVTDYVAWMVVGFAALGGLLAWALRMAG